ncbi:MAG TPA: ABC transporter ATP-binding protein [Conexivisphaerales archaeon]|nr:ABC transporter ATP-binding protein [Conexivisphaerales archaeon]
MTTLLEIDDLRTYFFTEAGVVKAVDGISLKVEHGETHGLVGESGSGKSVTALSTLRIVPRPGKIVGGSITFDGKDILSLKEKEMRAMRGRNMAIVFQDPMSSLDPLFTIENQLSEIIRLHRGATKQEAHDSARRLLEVVGIPEAERRLRAYPHELSGGMKQRIAIARALSCEPQLLFADEPTTNLDVTIQAQVLELMKSLKEKFNMTMVMITHDMGIIAEMAQRVTVLYAGQVYEASDTKSLFAKPKHPYTEALLKAVPRLDKKKELLSVPGNIPNLIEPPGGCRFHPRCPYAIAVCSEKVPILEDAGSGRQVACHRWRELDLKGV